MNNAFLTILSLSMSGSMLALVLFAGKPLLKNRVSKTFCYYIWLVVLLRLILPVSAPVNVVGTLFDMEQQHAAAEQIGRLKGNGTAQNGEQAVSPSKAQSVLPETRNSKTANIQTTTDMQWARFIWLAGSIVSFGWFLLAYTRFLRHMRRSYVTPHRYDLSVFNEMYRGRRVRMVCSSYAATPMLIGVFRPMIILPQFAYVKNGMEKELRNILRHELTHYRRKDILYKWLVVAITSIHWFNPLMLLMRKEIGRICELSCDEAVIREMSAEEKQSYGNTLLELSANRRLPTGILATTLCEGKNELKERLIGIMKYKKKSACAVALMIVLTFLIAGCGTTFGVMNVETTKLPAESNMPKEGATAYERLGYTILLPDDFHEKVTLKEQSQLNDNTIIEVYQTATQKKFPDLGFLFRIVRHTPAEFEDYFPQVDMIGGAKHFARDDNYYYSYEYPTDVQADLETTEIAEEYNALYGRIDSIASSFIETNHLTAYDHNAAVYEPKYTYPGNHAVYDITLTTGAKFTIILSQPIKQGRDGIWCVERMHDEYGNLYLAMPETDLTAAEYYKKQQDASAQEKTELLDAENVALAYLNDVWGWANSIRESHIKFINLRYSL